MKEIKAEIVRDTENIRCLINVDGLAIGELAVLAREHVATAGRLLAGEEFYAATRALEVALGYMDLCIRAQNQEDQWIESLPAEEGAA